MESDPVVSSTVMGPDSPITSPVAYGNIEEIGAKFQHGKSDQLYCCGSIENPDQPETTTDDPLNNENPLNNDDKLLDFSVKDMPSGSYFPDLEIPEMEFDEYDMKLADTGEDGDDAAYSLEPSSPHGLMDDDFEKHLGVPATELSIQDVIDSDFPDISRLGILQIAGDDKFGRKVIIFSACRLPTANLIDHQRLLLYITKTLEQYVSNDYCLIYFHYGLTSRNKPKFRWLVEAYRTLDRNFRKNLKSLYIVHPTTGIKILWSLFKPLISAKMYQKVFYMEYLKNLEEFVFLDQVPIPQRVIQHDKYLISRLKVTPKPATYSSGGTGIPPLDAVSVISGVFEEPFDDHSMAEATQQFHVSLQFLKMNNEGRTIPVVMEDAIDYLRDNHMDYEGIFRRSVSLRRLQAVQSAYNRGDSVDLKDYGDPNLAAALLKCFLRELTEPLLTFELYDDILSTNNLEGRAKLTAIQEMILTKLPDDNYEILHYLIRFLTEVTQHSNMNKMNASNLSVVLGPCLIWSRNQASLVVINVINAFVQMLITHYESIFIK